MLIGGIQTLSLLDFPEKISAIVFTVGCNFRCGFCHNPEFVDPNQIKKLTKDFIPEEKFFKFLESRKGFLDGVVVSGGEPTIHLDIIPFIEKIKNMNFLVKLDTNGTNPIVIKKLLEKKLIDYIAMDIKNIITEYNDICGAKVNLENIKKSRDLILNSGISHEFRTTVLQNFHNKEKITEIAKFCQGADRYTIQNFRPEKTLDEKFNTFYGFLPEQLAEFKVLAKKYIKNVIILGD